MGNVFFTSDTHFRHRFMAGLRGFGTVEEPGGNPVASWVAAEAHDEAVIARWNEMVGRRDTVWHLGDVGMSSGFLSLIGRLNGTVHLVAGNHDAVWPGHQGAHRHQRKWLEFFASVQPFARKRIAGHDVLLSHFPYEGDSRDKDRDTQFRLRDEGRWLLHGHVHSRERVSAPVLVPAIFGQQEQRYRCRQVHVGLDAWDLRPVPLSEVEALIRSAEQEEAAWSAALA